jgi:GT2 family glycosyltransferase
LIDLSVIVVSYNDVHDINILLSKLAVEFSSENINVEYIVSDNSDLTFYESEGTNGLDVTIVRGHGNSGFAVGANRGAAIASGRNFLFLNSDITFNGPEFLRLYHDFEKVETGTIVAPLLCPISESDLETGKMDLDNLSDMSASGGAYHFRWSRVLSKLGFGKRRFSECGPENSGSSFSSNCLEEVDWVAGTSMMMTRDTFNLGRGFSSSYFMYFEDVDFCWRLSLLGIKSCINRGVVIGHRENSQSTKGEILRKDSDYRVSRDRFLRKATPLYLRGFLPFLDLQ